MSEFGRDRIYYDNFAEHLQNAYNPNMFYPGLPNRWRDDDWRGLIDMIAAFGFNAFEFWLVPRLFCRAGLESDYGREFTRQLRVALAYARDKGLKTILLAGLATVGDDWRTLCPNLPGEWAEVRHLWDAWTKRLPELTGVAIFPGDPGACNRNGCTAETYIDKSLEIALLVKRNLPDAEIDFGTWGPPFFGWGLLDCPPGWQGEFIQSVQHSAWTYKPERARRSMEHLLRRLPEFPDPTAVSINLGFDPNGAGENDTSAVAWAREIARTHPVRTWDFSLTEGENAIIPHYRFRRLFQQRRREREAAPYSGGICFTMTPLLNQLSLYCAAQSFLRPDADHEAVVSDFCEELFGPAGRELGRYLPVFEVIPDWGNVDRPELGREACHQAMSELAELLEGLAGQERSTLPLLPSVTAWRQEMLWYARLYAELSGPSPDYDDAARRYWQRVYAIYDHLPEHVDPRPRQATRNFVDFFRKWAPKEGATPGMWVG